MMSCQDVAAIVRDHADGRLPGRAGLGVRFHLLMCSACRRYLRQLRAALAVARAQPAEPPPPAVEDAALAAFRARRDPDEPS